MERTHHLQHNLEKYQLNLLEKLQEQELSFKNDMHLQQ